MDPNHISQAEKRQQFRQAKRDAGIPMDAHTMGSPQFNAPNQGFQDPAQARQNVIGQQGFFSQNIAGYVGQKPQWQDHSGGHQFPNGLTQPSHGHMYHRDTARNYPGTQDHYYYKKPN